jgi:integrase
VLVTEADTLARTTNRGHTVERLLHEWLAHATPSLSPRTVLVTRGYIDTTICPVLGSIPVAKLTTEEIDRFYRRLLTVGGPRVKYTPATIRRVHGILRRALSQGLRWGWIARNPARDASPPRVPVKELRPPTPDEVARLFTLAAETNPRLALLVVLAASTGARRGELLALRWSDVDLDHNVVTIERGLILAGRELIEQGTKTHQSRRLALDEGTIGLLKAHREHMAENARAFGTVLPGNALVFSDSAEGTEPLRPDSASRAFRTLCERAGVEGVRFHDLRHYVATRLLGAGVDIRTVAGRLGHRNASTTLNVYSHFLPEADRDAADTLARLFGDALQAAKRA